jgi:hypothetical protein
MKDVEGRVEGPGKGAAVIERGGGRLTEIGGNENVLDRNHHVPRWETISR